MAAVDKNFTIEQGSTFSQVVFWEATPYVYKPITAISQAAPVQLTVPSHGLVNGWRVAIVSVQGMTQINAQNSPPKAKDYHEVVVLDGNTITIPTINAAGFTAYSAGGYLQFYTPVDLTGYTAQMDIKDKLGGTVLQALSSATGEISLDVTNKKITLTLTAAQTAAFTWASGVYDLELMSPTGVVTRLLSGNVTVTPEVTI